jgi:GDP-L-fucose synthase
MMKILVTGGSGMVGQNLLKSSRAAEHVIYAPSRNEVDLLSYDSTFLFLQSIKPDLIIHLAGKVGGIKANMLDPFGFFSENISINFNLIKAAKEIGTRRLLNFGSSCMYPANGESPLTEEKLLSGSLEQTNEGYALAKIMAQRMCSYINDQCVDLSYKTIIPCNIYGPFDKFDEVNAHLIPAIIRKLHSATLKNAENVTIWGDGTARREFIFVGDIVALLWDACDRFESLPELMNVGVGMDCSITDYYEIAASVIGYKGKFSFDLSEPTGMKQKLVCSKNAHKWGWRAKVDLRLGIKETYQFYKGLSLDG